MTRARTIKAKPDAGHTAVELLDPPPSEPVGRSIDGGRTVLHYPGVDVELDSKDVPAYLAAAERYGLTWRKAYGSTRSRPARSKWDSESF